MASRAVSQPPLPLAEVVERLHGAVEQSPGDQTEIVWVEVVHTAVSGHSAEETPTHTEATVLVRVRDGGRIGAYQTVPGTTGELSAAVRQALGQSRVRPPGPWRSPPAPPSERLQPADDLVDRELATLEAEDAHQRLADLLDTGERGRLAWAVGRMVMANSLGLEQQAAATCATLEVDVASPAGSKAGRAAASARSLEDLAMDRVVARARRRHPGEGEPDGASLPGNPVPVVLAPEAAIAWLALINHHALSSRSFRLATSCLRSRLGRSITAPGVRLVDDGTRPDGLPFPFDLYGWAKRPVALVAGGRFETPAVDRRLADELGLDPTPHAVAFTDSRASHLFLEAVGEDDGEAGETEEHLLARADGGVWIGALERPECYDAPEGRFQARVPGARRIEGGRLAAPLPELVWEDTLPRSLGALLALGREPLTLAREDGFRGGITAPAVCLEGVRFGG